MFGLTRVFAELGGQGTETVQNTSTTTAGGPMEMIISLLPMILIFVLLYFVMIRPQKKKEKELKAKIDAMQVGDKVVTIGGICGKVTKIKDEYVFIDSGNVGTPDEHSVLKFERSAIKTVETIHE